MHAYIWLTLCSTMKFERPTGFVGSIPRNWIDSNLPQCPFCKLPSLWEFAEEFKAIHISGPAITLRKKRYFFRCPNCLSIISASEPAVTKGGFPYQLANKGIRIESVGNNEKLKHLVGEKYPLVTLQEWARLEIPEGKKEYNVV